MREIKFRAYVKNGKYKGQILQVERIDLDFDTGDGVDAVHLVPPEDVCYHPELSIHDVDLLPFTGFKDGNLQEIYKGSVIEANKLLFKGTGLNKSDHISKEKIVFVVDYIQGAFLFYNPNKTLLLNCLFCEKGRKHIIESSAHYKVFENMPDNIYEKYIDFKVIGNIYENPELLEGDG
jgi:uncharacterized phage protein (TIGR01671 family)